MHAYDTRGRFLAHTFWGELEKIASARGLPHIAPSMLLARLGQAAETRTAAREALGMKRFLPFTQEFLANQASRRETKNVSNRLQGILKSQKARAIDAIRQGTSEQRNAGISYLKDARQAALNQHGSLPDFSLTAKGMSLKKKILLGGAAGGAGYIGYKALSPNPQNPYGQ